MLDEKEDIGTRRSKEEEGKKNENERSEYKQDDDDEKRDQNGIKQKEQKSFGQKFKFALTPNMTLLPLKLAIFCFNSAAFCILPYLTIHMLDIGISIKHMAIMYAIFPFLSMLASPIIGFLADEMGSYTRVLCIMLFSLGIFLLSLLAVPKVRLVEYQPEQMQLIMGQEATRLSWTGCQGCQLNELAQKDTISLPMSQLNNCSLSSFCETSQEAINICHYFNPENTSSCSEYTRKSQLLNISMRVGNAEQKTAFCSEGSGSALISLQNVGDLDDMSQDCEIICNVDTKQEGIKPVICHKDEGDRMLTNVVYFVLRGLANVCISANFILFDAQTLQMCKKEEASGRAGALGKQYVLAALAQAIISPSVGKIMDMVSEPGSPNYLVPFLGCGIFLAFTVVMVCFLQLDISLPKPEGYKALLGIFSNAKIDIFLLVVFVLGTLWGFLETFIFVFLKEEMGAPMYLLGLTITTGALVSIPFLYISDYVLLKVGRENIFILALTMYAVRYIGYSFITNPWMAFPFEALEIFTVHLMRIACIQFVGVLAPKGLLATLNGVVGGTHYGFGKGAGSLIGGALIAHTGSVAYSFRLFGIAAAGFAVLYFIYEYCLVKCLGTGRSETKPIASRSSSRSEEQNAEELKTFVNGEAKFETEVKPSDL